MGWSARERSTATLLSSLLGSLLGEAREVGTETFVMLAITRIA
jgi:hypothetical protein